MELLKPVCFVFYMIITVIPLMLCLASFLNISYHLPWCFHMFPLVVLQFPQVFVQFPSVFPLFTILDFRILEDFSSVEIGFNMNNKHHKLSIVFKPT